MGYVSKDQIERARQIHVLDYVLAHERDSIKRTGNSYRHVDHPSLAINENGWYRHSREAGSVTALDYLIHVRGYGLVQAVCKLLDEPPAHLGKPHSDKPYKTKHPQPIPSSTRPLPTPKPFAKPLRNGNNDRVISYLQSRGIDEMLIEDCIRRGDLYESRYSHNAVFIGRDKNGKARCAAMRGTFGNFKGDAPGSLKKYGFVLPPSSRNSNTVAVFESPIEALSHQTLCRKGFIPEFRGWRLSLDGASTLALTHFLSCNPLITRCIVCTNNDSAGNLAADRIAQLPGITAERSLPSRGSDFNQALQALQKEQRIQNRARHTNSPCL